MRRLASLGEPLAQRLERHQRLDHVEGDYGRAVRHDDPAPLSFFSASSMARWNVG